MRTVDSPTELPSGLFVFFLPLPLLNAGATTLDQDDQHKNKKSAGSNSDNCRSVHRVTPFPCLDPFLSHGAK